MGRFPVRATVHAATTGALALAVAVLGLVAAGCGNGGGHSAATAVVTTPRSSAPCKLNRAQRHTVARSLADIRRLRRIQAPMRTFSQRGAPNQEVMTGKFLLDLSTTHLPLKCLRAYSTLRRQRSVSAVLAPRGWRPTSPSWGTARAPRTRKRAPVDSFSARPSRAAA
jgi:hypothetical protein